MKKCSLLLILTSAVAVAQESYYDDVNIELTGQALYEELQTKLESYNIEYTYSDYRDNMPITDANPEDPNEVSLVYGFNDTDGNCITDRTRDNDSFGGDPCEYNREHTFARSLAEPSMGSANSTTTGIAADPHNLRPSDVQRNGLRGSKKFAAGNGDSGDVSSGNWYPGDEWRGDIARAMMYMYVRYEDRCLPSLVGVGTLQGDTQMLELFLQWNVDDPVSEFETQRNDPLEMDYGSRNPFIDNPYLATLIWGGPMAENKWDALSVSNSTTTKTILYPNPVVDILTLKNSNQLSEITIYDLSGRIINLYENHITGGEIVINVSNFPSGFYFITSGSNTQKFIKL